MRLHTFFRTFRSFAPDRRGNVAIMFALSASVLTIGLAGAVDYSHASSVRSKMQEALDTAVIAGEKASASGTQSAALTTAAEVFSGNFAAVSTSATSTFTFNADGSLSGSASYTMPTFFGAIMAQPNIAMGVRSKAAGSASSVCILLVDPSASQSLLANSGTNITASNCEIDVSSTANPDAIFNSGVTINASKTCLKSANYIKNGGTINNLTASCSTATNPYVGVLPAPASTTCSGATANGGNYNGGNVTLTPGVYCGWFNFNSAPTVTLQPGVYVIKNGGWNVDGGTWTGTGVTFYFADTSHIQFNSGMNMTLSAPTSGTYSGILFYEPDGLSVSQFVFDDSVSESLSGLIYLPSRQLTFNSTSNVSSPTVTVIADSAIFDTMNWNLSPSAQWPVSNGSATVHLTQ